MKASVGFVVLGDLAKGGTLEPLRVRGEPQRLTQNWERAQPVALGRPLAVDWVPVPHLDPDMDMERDPGDRSPQLSSRRVRTAPGSMRAQAFGLGAAQLARVEGVAHARGAVYLCATNGGPARLGQVWKLDLARRQLSLIVQPDDRALLDGPDNICPAPNGDLIVCEDGQGEDFVVGITPAGRLYPLARNAHNDDEFAGATFSPDGRTLYVNVQEPGITFAIWGPWERRRA